MNRAISRPVDYLVRQPSVVVLPTVETTDHDYSTVKYYADKVASACTCGNHAPPPGLADNPMTHVEECGYKIDSMFAVNEPYEILAV